MEQNSIVKTVSRKRRRLSDYFMARKEGVISGAADNDPAGIVTYLQMGAVTGYALLWLIVVATPMLIVIEEMSARVGIVMKKGIAKVFSEHYGKVLASILIGLVLVANVVTIGASIAGMADILAAALHLDGLYIYFVFLIAAVIGIILWRGKYASISRFLFLLTPVFLVYVITALIVTPNWKEVALGLIGAKMTTDLSYWALAVGALGTTIAPYIIFWEATEEVEASKKVADIPAGEGGIRLGMIYSNIISAFMVILAADVLYGDGGTIETVRQAATVLHPLVGSAAFTFFALGIVGAGVISVPVLAATTAHMVSDVFGWRAGLDESSKKAPGFYIVLLGAVAAGAGVVLSGINPITALVGSQIIAGCVAPFIVIGLMMIANSKKIMGKHINSPVANLVASATIILMFVAIGFFVYDLVK